MESVVLSVCLWRQLLQIIRVRSSSVGDAILGVSVIDYTDERMKFELEVVE